MSGPGLGVDSGGLIKRRLMVLIAGGLAAAAVGLLFGRMQQPEPTAFTGPIHAKQAKPSPQVRARPASNSDDPALVPPRTPREMILDAKEARDAERYAEAARLYSRAMAALAPEHELQATARFGRAEALRYLGRLPDALAEYREVVRLFPKAAVTADAKLMLKALDGRSTALRRRVPTDAKSKTVVTAPLGPPREMPGPEACRWILTRYLQDTSTAIAALERLRDRYSAEPCIYWNLGRKYESLQQNRSALAAYRRYTALQPDSPKAPAVQRRITNLEAKLRVGAP